MITRKYFFSSKVTHDDSSLCYSYYSGIINHNSLFENNEVALNSVREHSIDVLTGVVGRKLEAVDVEIVAFNRV